MKIHRSHKLGKDEARRRVDAVAENLAGQYNVSCHWEDDAMRVAGSGVNGSIAVADESIDIDVKLGMPLRLMESTIRSSIENVIDEHLA